jgi:ATP-dependent Clp protease adapter protein ClpS
MSIHQQKSVRFTFDMPLGMHRHLKIICAEDNVSMNAFVTKAIEQEFAAREESTSLKTYGKTRTAVLIHAKRRA